MVTGVVSRMGNTRSGSKPGPRSPSWRRAVVRSLAAAPAHGGKHIAWQRSVKPGNPTWPAPLVNLDGKAIGLNIARASRVSIYTFPARLVKWILDTLTPKPKTAPKRSSSAALARILDAPHEKLRGRVAASEELDGETECQPREGRRNRPGSARGQGREVAGGGSGKYAQN